jgi:hypothetical protein
VDDIENSFFGELRRGGRNHRRDMPPTTEHGGTPSRVRLTCVTSLAESSSEGRGTRRAG